jgi:hypothetical protein
MVAKMKPAMPQSIERRRPKQAEIQPAKGIVTAVATRFAVTTHAI